ncbi:hypothetical protein ACWDSL_41690 [Streptomyces sp. NPDC000941]
MTFVTKRRAVTDVLHSNEPKRVFYAFTRYDVDLPSTEVVRLFLQDSVAVRSGTEFGQRPAAHPAVLHSPLDTLDEGIARLASALGPLRAERV